MYNIIPLILILLSLGTIIYITIRKFPAMANLDVANIPAEKEAKFKERIISGRLKRGILKWYSRLNRFFRPANRAIATGFKWFYAKLIELKDSYKTDKTLPPEDLERRVVQLFEEAEEMRRLDDIVGAEKRLIEIIGLDAKNLKAFRALAALYFEKKDFEEAKETFKYILKLKEGDEEAYDGLARIAKESGDLTLAKDEYLASLNFNSRRGQTYYDLALVFEAMKNFEEALASLEKALEIEPANPRYLDTAIRISIIIKNKNAAGEYFEALAKANPENQKLAEIEAEIKSL